LAVQITPRQRIGGLLNWALGIEYDTVTYNAAITGAQRWAPALADAIKTCRRHVVFFKLVCEKRESRVSLQHFAKRSGQCDMYFDHPIFGTLNYASRSEQWPLALEFMTMAEPSEARLNVSETTTIPKSFMSMCLHVQSCSCPADNTATYLFFASA